jgi:hypothetical protein
VHVSGSQWTLTVQHNPTGPISWSPSAERLGTPYLAGDQLKFDIRSNDAGGDADYNDLVLTCTMQRSDVEYVLHGRVRTYSGLCRFNPCFPYPWLVIDSAANLVDLLRYPPVRAVLEELYPQRIYELEHPPLVRKPFPDPDPVPFRPMMIPLSAPVDQPQVVFRSAQPSGAAMRAPAAGAKAQIASMQAKQATASSSVSAQVSELARIKDRFAAVCTVQDRPGVLLRFVEYDRTTAELAGGPYEGMGVRHDLGLTVTDELGNYIFRFTQTLTDIVEETGDVPSGASLATELRPDILVQLGFLERPPSVQMSQILQGSSLAWSNNAANAWFRRCMAVAMGRLGALGQPSNSWDRPGLRMRLWTLVKNSATRIPRSVTW